MCVLQLFDLYSTVGNFLLMNTTISTCVFCFDVLVFVQLYPGKKKKNRNDDCEDEDEYDEDDESMEDSEEPSDSDDGGM